MNKDEIAKQIFQEIRDRPYRGTIFPEKAWNCYFKGIELIDKLVTLGFPMRARIGKIEWKDTPVPSHILELLPEDSLETHYYPEIFMDGEWKILDPSWNKSFAEKFNLPYSDFGKDNVSCFKITHLFDENEQAEYIWQWLHNRRDEEREYCHLYKRFIIAMNKWLEEVNP